MQVNSMSKMIRFRRPKATELACSWCGTAVPLPSGDFSGVCIDCGTVMFRGPLNFEGSSERSRDLGANPFVPAPAV